MRSLAITTIAATFAVAGAANAATMSAVAAVPLTLTNFNVNAVPGIAQFDASLGTLQSVELILTGTVVGNVELENLDATPATILYSIGALINASVGGLSTSDNFAANGSFDATAFDGEFDFEGTSGLSLFGLTATETVSSSSSAAGVLAFFTGLGFVDINVDAIGTSGASGAGNLVTRFGTSAMAELEVIYTYDVPPGVVPLPAALPLFAGALGLLGFARLRRKV